MNGYNFTERMRKVLAMGREEAARLHHEYVGTEHMLLALVREGEGAAAVALDRLGVDVPGLALRIEQVVKRGRAATTPGPDLPYTSRAKQVLELAMREARNLNHSYVGTEHLLLGLIAEQRGIAAQVLTEAGVTLEAARTEILHIMGVELRPVSASNAPLIGAAYAQLGDLRGKPLERIQVVFHYTDGRHFEGAFATSLEAIEFLAWAARRPG